MKIYELLNKPQRWCKNYEALDNAGYSVDCDSNKACRFCMLGAINKCYKDIDKIKEVCKKVAKLIKNTIYTSAMDKITNFNDKHTTTFKDVYAILKRANV